jgi:hypothetical protein
MKIDVPENINLHIPEKYILTVYVHPEKFSFSLHCPDDPGSYFFYKIDSTEQADTFSLFKDLFFDNEFFTFPFQRTCLLVFSPLFTYVPNAIYSDKYKEDFIKFIFSEKEEKFLDHSISLPKVRVLYPISETVYDFFDRSFNRPEFIHHSTPLITYFYDPNVKHKNRRMIINVHENGIDVLCFSRKSFVLGNHFPCEKIGDAIYYILYTWKQLKMDQNADSLCITGAHRLNEALVNELKPHIQQICSEPLPGEYRFEDIDAKNIPFELITFSSCGS